MQDPYRSARDSGDSFDFGGKLRSEIERMVSQGRFGAQGEAVSKALSDPRTRNAMLAGGAAMAYWMGPALLRRKRRRRKASPPADE
jgi:Arc/MetJ-type ribon-helix-helix transcriptional regulator